ncbi:MAG: CHASE2 domain-containing protein [Bacteroidota bacterium]
MEKQHGNIWLDSLFGTIFIYLFMYVISLIPALRIFEAFDAVGQALADFEMTDIAFNKLREPLPPDTTFVLVNMGNLDRSGIAEQIRIIDKYGPKVIGMDSFFKGYNDDTLGSLALAGALASVQADLVMVSKVEQTDSLAALHEGEELYDYLYTSDSMYTFNAHQAIANLDTKARFQDDVKICRAFPPKRTDLSTGIVHVAFAAKMAELYEPGITDKLMERGKDYEIINFRGDFVNFFGEGDKFATRFYALDWDQVLSEDFVPELLKDKIVLFGFLGAYFGAPQWEDKFFTPINPKIAGRANPDMFGPVIHANIASMILNDDYVDTFSETVDIILGLILCFMNVLLFSYIYRKYGVWYDGLTKLIQVFEVALVLLLIIQIFSAHSFKIEITYGLIALALAGDLLEVYYGVVKNLFTQAGRRLMFKKTKKRKVQLK